MIDKNQDQIVSDAVSAGMSGGIVTTLDYEAVGVLVTQGSATDLDNDNKLDQSADIVALFDIKEALID